MSACESCGRPAHATAEPAAVDFIESYEEISDPFQLCVRCVPVELRAAVEAIPGHEDLLEVELALLAFHRQPVPAGAQAGA